MMDSSFSSVVTPVFLQKDFSIRCTAKSVILASRAKNAKVVRAAAIG